MDQSSQWTRSTSHSPIGDKWHLRLPSTIAVRKPRAWDDRPPGTSPVAFLGGRDTNAKPADEVFSLLIG
jgi:hypothetical protein